MPRLDLLENVLEVIGDATVVADAEGRVLLVNDQVERLSGYPRDEVVGRGIELLVPAWRERRGERFRLAADGHAIGIEVGLRRRDGAEVPVGITLRALPTGDGPRVLAVVRDASPPREGERALLVEERLRVAAVFDDVIQRLFSIGMSLHHVVELSRQPEVARRLERDLTMIDAVIRDLRRSVYDPDA